MGSTAALAAAVASRLAEVLPKGFAIEAIEDGIRVSFDNDAAWFGGADIYAQGITLTESLEGYAWNLLNDVQDYVIVTIRDAWPKSSTGQPGMPCARVVSRQLHLWYGDEADPVLRLAPIEITP